jgi:hypothetical protein
MSTQEYTNSCVKCGSQYKSNDPDPYYCVPCKKAHNKLAAEVEAKVKARPPKRKAPSFNDKMAGFQTQKGITLINVPRR